MPNAKTAKQNANTQHNRVVHKKQNGSGTQCSAFMGGVMPEAWK